MIRNFFKMALRFLWRNKKYSILNFLCLSFGLACSIIAVSYVLNIVNFNKFHENYERLFQVEAIVTFFNGDRFSKEPLSASLDEVLIKNVPEIESLARITSDDFEVINNDKSFNINGIYADGSFFNMFSFPVISGSAEALMSGMNAIAITELTAKKLFNTTDCLGKSVILKDSDSREPYIITCVIKDVPTQSSLQFDFVIPFSKFLKVSSWANETGSSANHIWVLLKKNVSISTVNSKIKDLIKSQESTLNQELFLFPLKEKSLYRYAGGKRVWGNMQTVVIVGTVGFAILLIACFNFINLAIAINRRRYREAGIKKVAGATRSSIIVDFFGETFLLIFLSLVLAIDLSTMGIKGFNTLFDSKIYFSLADGKIIMALIAITLFTGLFSGLLPALYLSSSNPVNILKGKVIKGHSFSFFRQGIIAFQFTIPVILIICMMIIKIQDKFMHDFDIGFDKEKVIILNNTANLEFHEGSFKADLLAIPGIEAVSFTNCIPARGTKVSNEVSWEGKDIMEKFHFWCINTDFDYNKIITIDIKDGRYFDKSFPSDSACYIINDITAEIIENKNPVGSTITLEGKKGTIIGVFKNFHAVDLAGPFAPIIISVSKESREYVLIRFSSGSYSEINEKIAQVYKVYEPGLPFKPALYNDLPDYAGLSTPSKLTGLAFFIALLLACLGLSGLASFTTECRTKEIGIRKTNGATTFSIMQLLAGEYTRKLIIAFIFSLPVAFFLGKMFLARFHFHTTIPFWPFLAGPAVTYSVALLTVGWQSWRAATKNPVEALRYE